MTIIDELLDPAMPCLEPEASGRAAGRPSSHEGAGALAVHRNIVRAYERACKERTFDFETDIGRFIASDLTMVWAGTVGGRSLLCELSEARADYLRETGATVTVDLHSTCVAYAGAAVAVIVARGEMRFITADGLMFSDAAVVSSTFHLLGGEWVLQHLHIGSI